MSREHLPYEPALDGLRAFAAFAVVLMHCHVPGLSAGYLGVDLFFVLSGYLITSNLLLEHGRTGAIALGRFYWRRARRLYPALLLLLAVYLVLAPFIWPGKPHARDALIAGLYLSDYWLTITGDPVYLGHTWSLAAEEHFYLLWPLVLIWSLRRAPLPVLARWLALATVLAWVWRVLNIEAGYYVGFRFDTRLIGLLAGCWLAVVCRWRPAWLERVSRRGVALAGAAIMAGLFVAVPAGIGAATYLPLIELASVALVFGASTLPIRGRVLQYLGKLSYGIYLWHFPIVKAVSGPWYVEAAIVVPLSVGMAWLSYETVERVFRQRAQPAPAPVTA
jgi:peptidoglycan/LPS O-acetylase OafA/YrhL